MRRGALDVSHIWVGTRPLPHDCRPAKVCRALSGGHEVKAMTAKSTASQLGAASSPATEGADMTSTHGELKPDCQTSDYFGNSHGPCGLARTRI